jgi:hypothetical protein
VVTASGRALPEFIFHRPARALSCLAVAIVRLGQFASVIALLATPLAGAAASPPPPPPSYVEAVASLLSHAEDADAVTKLSRFVADDVRAYVNDRLVADGKAAWMRHYAASGIGTVLGYSDGWQKDGASLMIVDQYDTVDRSNLPATTVMDPRYSTRATLYQFGQDRKIHAIRTLIGTGFWIKPQR